MLLIAVALGPSRWRTTADVLAAVTQNNLAGPYRTLAGLSGVLLSFLLTAFYKRSGCCGSSQPDDTEPGPATPEQWASRVKPYTDNIVTFRMLHSGYLGASRRFHDASKERDKVAAFHPLFEALNWAVALDNRIGAHWAPEGKPLGWEWRERVSNGDLVQGLRWARNSVHHQWSDALVATDGRRYPKTYPVVYFEWLWRPASDYPRLKKIRPNGQAAYERRLQGTPARVTLSELGEVFTYVRELLEPPRHAD